MKQLDPVRRAESMAHRLRRRIAAALFLRGFLRASGAAWFAAGALVLAVRIFARPLPDAVPWGIAVAALVVSAAIAGCSAAKQLPGIRRLLAWLDGAGASGGLLTASLEVAPGAWRERIVLPAMPKIRTGGAREWVAPAAGAAFLAGTLLIPQSRIAPQEHYALDISAETAELEQKLEVLEEESLMREEELDGMHAALDELELDNDARDTARTYELLDALARKVDLAGEEAGERVRNELETLRMLSLALDSLNALPLDQVPPEAAAQMSALLEELAQENPELAKMLADSGAATAKLDPGTMKRLAEAMRDSSGGLERKLAKLVEQKLLKSRCARPGQCDGGDGSCASPGSCPYGEDLATWLEKNAPGADGLLAACAMCEPQPGGRSGAGEPGRGRADAMLRYIGNTPEFSGKKMDLAVAGVNDPAQSMVVQRFAGAPDVDGSERRAAAAGHLRGGDAEVEQRDARIYPEHRAAVERYFKPKEK